MKPQMVSGRLDTEKPRPVAYVDAKRAAIPVEVGGPIHPGNAIDRFIRGGAVAGFIPGLETQPCQTEFGPRQPFRRTQLVHARAAQPGAGRSSVAGGIDQGDLADAGTTQRKGERASGLPAADDGDVVIDPLTVRDPVLRIGSNQAQGLARRSVDIGLKHIRTSIFQRQMRSNRRSERYSVNEMESALFFNPHNEPIAGLRRVERFA